MTAKVDEVLNKIPSLKINLNEVVDFKDKCLDPLAISIITESLDYALETSVRRLESVAKINPSIRDTAVETVLPAVKTLKEIIERAPSCSTSALGEAPILPAPPPRRVRTSKPKTAKEHVENLTKAVTKAKATAKKKPAPTKTISIESGRIVEITFDGESKKFLVADQKVMKNPLQVPSEEGVVKLPINAPLAQQIMGKKTGDTAEIVVEDKTYKATIKDVREAGPMKIIEVKEKK